MPIKLGRISRQKDFDKIFRSGKLWQNDLFVLRSLDNGLKQARLAAVVSNKISKKAVKRNKLRRRIKEIVRQEAGAAGGIDFIFIAKAGATATDFPEIKAAVVDLLKKADV